MADECPGATASPARLSGPDAEEEAEADLLATVSLEARTTSKPADDGGRRVKRLHKGGHLVAPQGQL
eukprot:2762475-Pleurochrysis_carterae.AAC.1